MIYLHWRLDEQSVIAVYWTNGLTFNTGTSKTKYRTVSRSYEVLYTRSKLLYLSTNYSPFSPSIDFFSYIFPTWNRKSQKQARKCWADTTLRSETNWHQWALLSFTAIMTSENTNTLAETLREGDGGIHDETFQTMLSVFK